MRPARAVARSWESQDCRKPRHCEMRSSERCRRAGRDTWRRFPPWSGIARQFSSPATAWILRVSEPGFPVQQHGCGRGCLNFRCRSCGDGIRSWRRGFRRCGGINSSKPRGGEKLAGVLQFLTQFPHLGARLSILGAHFFDHRAQFAHLRIEFAHRSVTGLRCRAV